MKNSAPRSSRAPPGRALDRGGNLSCRAGPAHPYTRNDFSDTIQRMRFPWSRAEETPEERHMTILTSQPGWFPRLARAYHDRTPLQLVDDAHVGIDPQNQSLVAMGIKAGLSVADWVAVGVAVGVSAAGVMMVIMAVLDPEPTSKLGLLVGGGAVCVVTGGLTAVGILTRRRPPSITMGPGGFTIKWE
jgi:hypothetical protein